MTLLFAIDGASVSHPYDKHKQFGVVYLVNDAIVTDADAEKAALTGKSLYSVGSRVFT